jgi:acetyl-CoA C-acetyltransferase
VTPLKPPVARRVATGARIVATPAKLLAERGSTGRGLISVCAAGGRG